MRPKSFKSIMATLRMLTDWAGTDEISRLDHNMIKDFLYWGKEEKLWEASTFRNHRQYLQSFFAWCIKQQLIKSNPIDGIEKPKLPKRVPRGLSKQDTQTVLNSARWYPWHYNSEALRNETILYTFTYTGLRLEELLGLEDTDINLKSREILVRQGKGQKDRVVPIHPKLAPILEGYNEGRKYKSRHYFTGANSQLRLYPKDLQVVCRKLSAETGIKFTPHTLRHTFGRLCIEAGWSIYKIKEVMGHADISTTQRYLHASTENIKTTFDEIDLL